MSGTSVRIVGWPDDANRAPCLRLTVSNQSLLPKVTFDGNLTSHTSGSGQRALSVARSNSGRVQGRLCRLRQLSGSLLILEKCMPNLRKLRDNAYRRQAGLCWYCGLVMAPANDGRPNRCTAEHLTARSGGGLDPPDNVVAACWFCNSRRHRRKTPLGPLAYTTYVRRRIAMEKWHCRRARASAKTQIQPPSTTMICPVTIRLSSEPSQVAMLATSWG